MLRLSAETEANVRRTRDFFEAMRPFLADAAYVNYLGEVAEAGVHAAYGRKYDQLATLTSGQGPSAPAPHDARARCGADTAFWNDLRVQ